MATILGLIWKMEGWIRAWEEFKSNSPLNVVKGESVTADENYEQKKTLWGKA